MTTKHYGYCEPSALPVKAGDTITIKRGTKVKCRDITFPAGRNYKVKVNHILRGSSICVGYLCRNGVFEASWSDRRDAERIKKKYGTLDFAILFPLMTVIDRQVFLAMSPPLVRWAGSGGYWAECDINEV